jgi:hypothetical protein
MGDLDEAETWLATARVAFDLGGAPRARYTSWLRSASTH